MYLSLHATNLFRLNASCMQSEDKHHYRIVSISYPPLITGPTDIYIYIHLLLENFTLLYSLQLRQTYTPCHNKRLPQTMNSLLSCPSDLHSCKRERAICRGGGGDFRVYTTVTANFRVIARQCLSRGNISSPITPERRKKETDR